MATPSPRSGATLAPKRCSPLATPRRAPVLLLAAAVAVLVGAAFPLAAAQLVDASLCQQSCPGAQPLSGQCFQTCQAGCCFSAWAAAPSLTDLNPLGQCLNGTCGGIDPSNLAPCQACPTFPQGTNTQGFCLSGTVPLLCRGGQSFNIFVVRNGLVPSIGNCTAGPCTAPAPGTSTGGTPTGAAMPPPPPKGALPARHIWVALSGFLVLLWLAVEL